MAAPPPWRYDVDRQVPSTENRPHDLAVLECDIQIAHRPYRGWTAKDLLVDALDVLDFGVGQRVELTLARPVRQSPAILMQKPEQQIDRRVRHIDDVQHVSLKLIVAPQEIRLARKILLDSLPYAGE